MIIPNGTIRVHVKSGGGVVHGRGIPIEETLGEPIPCHLSVITYDQRGVYDGGNFKRSAFDILIDGVIFEGDKITLYDMVGEELGVFQIQRTQKLYSVQKTRIIV